MNPFVELMAFLRDREQFLEDVSQEKQINHRIFSFLACSLLSFTLYGALIGLSSSWLQMLVSAIKLPTLYLITLVICLPTLFFIEILRGSKRSFKQYLVLLLAAMSIIGVLLFSVMPITLFFHLTVNDYQFFKLLNVCIFTLTGIAGIVFFYQGITFFIQQDFKQNVPQRTNAIKAWLALYGFVGSQMGWALRPFFGDPNAPFELFRKLESNFYAHIWWVITRSLDLQ